MSQSYVFSESEYSLLLKLKDYAKEWADKNKLATGLAEMTVGAGLIAWGVQNGAIEMGIQLVATHLMDDELNGFNIESLAGAAAGAGLGALAGKIIGSIGLAALGGAIGIPAALVIGGCSAVLALAGYVAGDIIHNTINPPVTLETFLENGGSILMVGVALLVHGARACLQNDRVNSAFSYLKDKTLNLKPLAVKVIAQNKDELAAIATGASVGGIVASSTGSVIAAKSSGLGVLLGASSAPVLPVVLGVLGGAGVGYTLYKLAKRKGKKDVEEIPVIAYWDDTPPLPPPDNA